MNSRERVIEAINHRKPDRVPVDLGGTAVSGISATAYYRLRQALGLKAKPVEILEILQFVANVDDDVREKLKVDIKALPYPVDTLGNLNKEFKVFTSPIGIPAAVSIDTAWDVLEDHSVVLYPQGDKSVPPSARMLGDGMFFDNITSRIPDFDEDNLTPLEDYKNDFSLITEEIAEMLKKESENMYFNTEYALCGIFPMALLGDAGITPAPFLKEPKGIRRMEDWLMAHMLYPDYIRSVFEMQTEMALKNLEIYKQAVGERIQIIFMSSADYGNQNSEMISPEIFRDLYKPFYKKMNDWVHKNTNWKTFYHSCGSIVNLLDDYVDMGADIINPLQLSAKGMDGKMLHEKYQKDLVFWGGGVNTQETLAFGTPEDIRKEVLERLELFSKDGGYIFNPVHNIVGNTKIENIIALFDAVKEFNK